MEPDEVLAPGVPVQTAATVAAMVAAVGDRFRKLGLPAPRSDASLLVAAVVGAGKADIIGQPERVLPAAAMARLAQMADRRCHGEPVSRILGRREFWGLEFTVTPAVLDPRPDTETVVEAALAIVDLEGWRDRRLRILDLCTGSGCILLSLLSELPHATGIGTDISAHALSVAGLNTTTLRMSDRAGFILTSFGAGLDEPFDLIVSNPPYIRSRDIASLQSEVRDFDPRLALDGGEDGLDAYRAIASAARRTMRGTLESRPEGEARHTAKADTNSWIVLEVGHGQHEPVTHLLANAGLEPGSPGIHLRQDLAGIVRVVAAKTLY